MSRRQGYIYAPNVGTDGESIKVKYGSEKLIVDTPHDYLVII